MYQVKLMAVKVCKQYCHTYDVLKGFEYMLAKNATLSNHSYGGSIVNATTKALYNNIAANNPNHLFVFAAGNSNQELNVNNQRFGCALEMPNQLCVAASTSSDTKASFSNYGTGMVHVFAPGKSILSSFKGGSYGYYSGTSMASPHVTGLAAMIMTMKDVNGSELKALITDNVQTKSQYTSYVSTGGLIDAYESIKAMGNIVNILL